MLLEDVLTESVTGVPEASADPVGSRRVLRSTLDTPLPRRRALRAHHLPHNNYIRPRRLKQRRLVGTGEEDEQDLLDLIHIAGGFDGREISARFELDVSRQLVSSLDELIQKPLDLLNDVDFLKSILPSAGGDELPVSLDANISLAASAHVGVLGTCTI